MRAQTADLRPIIHAGAPLAAVELLRHLGWHGERARVDHVLGTPPQYDRLLLGTELTGAGTQSTGANDLWWVGFQQGARYHLSVVDRRVHWYDFQERLEWTVSEDDDLRPLNGLSPERFASTGSFAPDVAKLARSKCLPEKPPQEYLTQLVRDWWRQYLRLDAPPEQHAVLQQRFVDLVARLVLVRTIEDVGGRQWLESGTLRSFAETPRTVNRAMTDLFSRLRAKVNSQVFSDNRSDLPESSAMVSLLRSLYEVKGRTLDFAAIEFNMIGRFYERVLGEHHSLQSSPQLTLIGTQEREVTSISHRRELGQYYTPRAFADYLAQKVVLPHVRAARDVRDLPRVADIAVGSGELLNAALRVMLSVAQFRTPEAIRYILEEKLVGVDINATATKLTALNLLRTAVLLCPELLDQTPAFPAIGGLYAGDATESFLERVGPVDVVLTNPPFRGQPDWRDDVEAKKKGDELGGQINKAGLFLLRAAKMIRENGSMGIVLPNQFFSSAGNREIRRRALEMLDVIELVDNQGARAFDGVKHQPGVLIANVAPTVRAPRMIVTRLAPRKEHDRAVLVTGLANSPGLTRIVSSKPDARSDSWFGDPEAVVAAARHARVPIVPITDLLSGSLSRAPIVNVGGLENLWRADRKDSGFVLRASGTIALSEDFPYLKKVAAPRRGTSGLLRPFSDPDHRIVFPYDDRGEPLVLDELPEGAMAEACRAIVERARESLPLGNRDNEAYRRRLASGKLGFVRLMRFHAGRPYVLLSRAARITAHDELWSAWAFSGTEGVVPVSGLFGHTSTAEMAQLLAVVLNTQLVFEQLRIVGTARDSGWVEIRPEGASRILVPDLRAPALSKKVAALLGAIRAYVARAEEDLTTLKSLAEELWIP